MSQAIAKHIDLNYKRRLKILVAGGASAGHTFAALAFLDSLRRKDKDIKICLLLPKRREGKKFSHHFYPVKYVSSIWDRKGMKNLFRGSLESIFIILSFRPDLVVGFGSITSVPVVILARALGIKTLIHEQNVIPGRANKLAAKFSHKIAISFAESKDYFKRYQKKLIFTGNPLRDELTRIDKDKALDFFGFSGERFTILVMGGSQGSQRINAEFLKTISLLPDKQNLQVIHLAGSRDYESLRHAYRDPGLRVRLFSFLQPMHYAYSAADLVISRAGALTVSELIFFRLPAILIPYPYVYQHQLANARVLERMGLATVIKEDELGAGILMQAIENFIANPEAAKPAPSCDEAILKNNANELLANHALELTSRS